MINVLNIITPGLNKNGILTTQLQVFNCLDKEHIVVDFITTQDTDDEVVKNMRSIGCNVIAISDRKRNTISYMRDLLSLMRKKHYDVVHVHGSSSIMGLELLISKIKGVQVRIAHCHNTTNIHKNIDRLLKPFFLRSYTHGVACGKDAGDFLFRGKRYEIVHYGIDIEKFRFSKNLRDELRKKYDIRDKVVVGFIGALIERKNVGFLYELIENILKVRDDVVFIIADGGHDEVGFANKIRKYFDDGRVIMLGSINNVNEVLCMMDYILLPSRAEGLPVIILEAQASGLNCLVSEEVTRECNASGLVEFLPTNNGTGAWEKRIKGSEDDDIDRTKISEIAVKALYNEKFDMMSETRRLVEIFKGK